MAFKLADAFIAITSDDTAVGRTFNNVRRNVGGLVGDATKQLATIGGGAILGGITAVGTGLAAVGVQAFRMGADLDAAQKALQGQLGVTEERAASLADITQGIFGGRFADSIEEANTALIRTQQNLDGFNLNDADLQSATQNALAFSKAAEQDLSKSLNVARTLMERFDISQQQAFDLMAKGMQEGLDSSGDFLDSLGEYSNMFDEAGFSAGQMFNILESGAEGGVLGVDRIADLIKEANIRITEGGPAAREALNALGVDAAATYQQMSDGTLTVADLFNNQLVPALQNISDPIERQRLQVALFGTKAEDLGASFLDGLNTAERSMDSFSGSTAQMAEQLNGAGSGWDQMKRRAMLALAPIGESLVNVGQRLAPYMWAAFERIEAVVVPAMETAAQVIESFLNNLEEGMTPLNAFIEAIWGIAPQPVLDALVNFRDNILPGLQTKFAEISTTVAEFVNTHWESLKGGLIAVGAVIGGAMVVGAITLLGGLLAGLLSPITAIIAIVALLGAAWNGNWGGIQEKTATAIAFIKTTIQDGLAIIQGFWDQHGEKITAFLTSFWESAIGFFTAGSDGLKLILEGFIAAFEGDWETFGANIVDGVIKMVSDLVSEIGQIWEKIRPHIETAINNVVEWFTSQDWGQIGSDIIDGIVEGITGALSRLWGAASGAVRGAIDAAKDAADINSPSGVAADEIGAPITQGVIEGMERERPELERSLGRVVMGGIQSAPQPAPAAVAAGGITIQFNGPVYGLRDFEQQVTEITNKALGRRSNARGRAQ